MINLGEIPEAELARRCDMAAPVLFRYLRAKRRPSAPMVRRINAAVGKLFGEPNITNYLSAVASRDDLISADGRSVEDFTDVLSFLLKDMRDGFESEFRVAFVSLSELNRISLRADLIADFRRRLIRHVTGEISTETKLEAYLRIIYAYGIPARDWLKPEMTHERESDARTFHNAVTVSLASTSLRVTERTECETAIGVAFGNYCTRVLDEHIRDTRRIEDSLYQLGYHKAREEIFSQLAKGKIKLAKDEIPK